MEALYIVGILAAMVTTGFIFATWPSSTPVKPPKNDEFQPSVTNLSGKRKRKMVQLQVPLSRNAKMWIRVPTFNS